MIMNESGYLTLNVMKKTTALRKGEIKNKEWPKATPSMATAGKYATMIEVASATNRVFWGFPPSFLPSYIHPTFSASRPPTAIHAILSSSGQLWSSRRSLLVPFTGSHFIQLVSRQISGWYPPRFGSTRRSCYSERHGGPRDATSVATYKEQEIKADLIIGRYDATAGFTTRPRERLRGGRLEETDLSLCSSLGRFAKAICSVITFMARTGLRISARFSNQHFRYATNRTRHSFGAIRNIVELPELLGAISRAVGLLPRHFMHPRQTPSAHSRHTRTLPSI
ncbi:hypothetical protein BDZ89DRAFT_1222258 [Hymenopellis radicata]|nr:hypothetical protein BDZ89DRAFT_1222258 [Hymenopellis radicata]